MQKEDLYFISLLREVTYLSLNTFYVSPKTRTSTTATAEAGQSYITELRASVPKKPFQLWFRVELASGLEIMISDRYYITQQSLGICPP